MRAAEGGRAVGVEASARVSQICRNPCASCRTTLIDDVTNLCQTTVSDDVEEILFSILTKLLVDQLTVTMSTVAVEAKLDQCDDADDEGGQAHAQENAEKVVFVCGR